MVRNTKNMASYGCYRLSDIVLSTLKAIFIRNSANKHSRLVKFFGFVFVFGLFKDVIIKQDY